MIAQRKGMSALELLLVTTALALAGWILMEGVAAFAAYRDLRSARDASSTTDPYIDHELHAP